MDINKIQIAGCAICQDRKEEIVPNVKQMYPYVDYFVLINGGNTDGWVEEVKDLDIENKIHIVDFPWCDNFPVSRNKYIEYAGKFRDPNKTLYLARFDSDEFYSLSLLKKLRLFIQYVEQNYKDMLSIRCVGITLNKQKEEISKTLDNYWKGLVYKWYPELKYIAAGYGGSVHEDYNHHFDAYQLPSCDEKYGLENSYHYKHVKEQGAVWERAQRNFFIGGGGPNYGENQPLWKPFRELLDRFMPEKPINYHDYISYLRKGNINQVIKNWIISVMYEGIEDKPAIWKKYMLPYLVPDETDFISEAEKKFGWNYDGASEVREAYKVYFRWYHEGEEPKELRELHIP